MRQSGFPITLTTDFGLQDEYVGVMKGVILMINKGIPIIDLTHGIPPQDIRQAARVIGNNYRYFPPGTVHVCVVDPGVGTNRRIIALQCDTLFFIGPDNGVFTQLLNSSESVDVYQVENQKLFLKNVSKTFHGRDIMAPVAARLASGMSIVHVGPRIARDACALISLRDPIVKRDGIAGEVISVDSFGNLRTNITKAHLSRVDLGEKPCVTLRSYAIGFSSGSYEDVSDTLPTAIINSSGELEVCVKKGNAARLLRAGRGERVFVHGHRSGCQDADLAI
ncbi:SAM hydrolase/SAM-dependent halogenase family protein [Desulfofustis limnaeus]|jgi:S-adenosylmethionine hydrolase|nr:SAM-dependent chlorinase/fluorinase [Desulfofustis limnaeus]MDX9894858.1 SAM-dependent chlorinase/fluorinase [Desulfofustis sp.]